LKSQFYSTQYSDDTVDHILSKGIDHDDEKEEEEPVVLYNPTTQQQQQTRQDVKEDQTSDYDNSKQIVDSNSSVEVTRITPSPGCGGGGCSDEVDDSDHAPDNASIEPNFNDDDSFDNNDSQSADKKNESMDGDDEEEEESISLYDIMAGRHYRSEEVFNIKNEGTIDTPELPEEEYEQVYMIVCVYCFFKPPLRSMLHAL
jgi:hypothetical protein